MDQSQILSRLATSLAIGLLVGLERGWRTRGEQDHQRAAGFRTFALSGLLGGVTGAVALQTNGLVIGFVFLGYAAAFAAFHWLEAKAERNVSVTSVVAGMLTFLLGTMSVASDPRVAIACAVAMTGLLALREWIHSGIASLTWHELRAILILLAMSFLLLPVLPNRTIDPWNSINLYEIWLLAILTAGISFVGYVAVRILGDRLGIVTTAIAGGLASSTVTTLTFARLNREHPGSFRLLSAGILIAGAVMLARVAAVAVALNQALFGPLVLPLASAATILAMGAAILLLSNIERNTPKLLMQNPLAFGTALKSAAFIGAVILTAEIVRQTFGSTGVLMVAALSGIADVDAVTISMARLGGGDLNLTIAAQAIMIAVSVNTISKAMIAGWAGGRDIGILVGGVSGVAVATGLAATIWQISG
ncbi:MAG: MgtC/SapB family protein [Afipia sp.]|nr:MgtC/SapB family protein [Afipia sp.]